MREVLQETGPLTVPNIAHARAVSRQATQRLVEDLLAVGMSPRTADPAHHRSPRKVCWGAALLLALSVAVVAHTGCRHLREAAWAQRRRLRRRGRRFRGRLHGRRLAGSRHPRGLVAHTSPRRRCEMSGPQGRTAVPRQAGGLPVTVAAEPLVGGVPVGVVRAGAASALHGIGVPLTDAALSADAQCGEQGFASRLTLVGDPSEHSADPLVHRLCRRDAGGLLHGSAELPVGHRRTVSTCRLEQHRASRLRPCRTGGGSADLSGVERFRSGVASHSAMSTGPLARRHACLPTTRRCCEVHPRRHATPASGVSLSMAR